MELSQRRMSLTFKNRFRSSPVKQLMFRLSCPFISSFLFRFSRLLLYLTIQSGSLSSYFVYLVPCGQGIVQEFNLRQAMELIVQEFRFRGGVQSVSGSVAKGHGIA